MSQEFSFIIAKVWRPLEPVTFKNLGIYTYFETIHTGTKETALGLLSEIQRKNPDNKYYVFPVNLGEALNE
jgi:hypothetical protein